MLDINYLKLKKQLLKNFDNQKIYIEIFGVINTRYSIENAKILINKHKLIIANEETDCILLLDYVKKVKIDEGVTITLFSKDEKFVLEI